MKRLQITQWCHERIRQMVSHPIHCLDATAGTGRDTSFLLEITDPAGTVIAMDIQEEAIRQTAARITKKHPGCLYCVREAYNPDNSGWEDPSAGQGLQPKNPDQVGIPVHSPEGIPSGREPQLILIHDSHENMEQYAAAGSQDLILFNLGYLPGGDHSLATKPQTTLTALNKSLNLLREGGLLSVLIYSGGDSGFAEKDAVLAWAKDLNPSRYLVLVESFYNKPNNPPIPLFVRKL